MRFYAPTDVFIEKNCVANHKQDIARYGKRAFIITGKHSSKVNGSLDDVINTLKSCDISYEIFSDIEENPSVETVAKATAIGKDFKTDFVIGVGGGSALDASKAISLLIANPNETTDCLYVSKQLAPLPIVSVPTTCGTGSEVTPNAVLTRHEFKTKKSISYNLYPDLALVDGSYLKSASKNLLINTAADALAHCIESRLHAKANIFNHMFSEYGLRIWAECIPFLKEDQPLTDDTAGKLMLASTLAGMAIAQTGTSLPHALSYDITYQKGVAHGKACSIFLSSYMQEYARNRKEDVNQILSILGFASIKDFGDFLYHLTGCVNVTDDDISYYTDRMMENTSKLSTYPFKLERIDIENILKNSLLH